MIHNTTELWGHVGIPMSPFEAILWLLRIVVTMAVNSLLVAIIHYERFGGDPQKRSLINRLTSDMVWTIIFQLGLSLIWQVGYKAKLLSSNYIHFVMHARRALYISLLMFLNLQSLVLYCHVVIYKRVMEINDELCSSFLRRATYMGCFWLSFTTPLDKLMKKYLGIEQDSDIAQWDCLDQLRCVPWSFENHAF